MACRLIPLDKKPGLRPIGLGEVLRRIAGKAVMIKFKNRITHAAVALQVVAKQDSGVEAVIQAVLIQGPTRPIHPVAYDDMDESIIM